MSGLEAIQAIQAEFVDASILVLTTDSDAVEVRQAARLGAACCLGKETLQKALLQTIPINPTASPTFAAFSCFASFAQSPLAGSLPYCFHGESRNRRTQG